MSGQPWVSFLRQLFALCLKIGFLIGLGSSPGLGQARQSASLQASSLLQLLRAGVTGTGLCMALEFLTGPRECSKRPLDH